MHLTNKEILDKLLSYSENLKHHYNLYQLLLFHLFFRLCLKPSSKIKRKSSTPFNYLIPNSNAKLEATNNLIKLIKHNAFGFRNFENFKKERTKFVLSISSLSSTHYSWQRTEKCLASNIVNWNKNKTKEPRKRYCNVVIPFWGSFWYEPMFSQ